MPTKTAEKQKTSKQQVTTTGRGALPAAAAAAAAQYAGAGVSHAQEDNIVPLIYLLQSNSKACQKGHENYVKGATGGDWWLRNESDGENLISGEEGMVFQPCHFGKCWIQWMPNRGGFVTRHRQRPEAAELKDVERDDGTVVKRWVMPNDDVVVETREYAGLVHLDDGRRLPYVIPFSSTGHTPAKEWMTSAGKKKLPSGDEAPLFAYLYRLKTKLRTKGENSWYQASIEDEGPVTSVADVEAGAAIWQAFESGEKQAAAMEQEDEPAGASTSDADPDEGE